MNVQIRSLGEADENMRIFMNDFAAQWRHLGPRIHEVVERVGASGWYILGGEVASFEQELARRWGVRAVVGCASGLDAIEIGLRIFGVGPGDEVLTTPLSAFATTLAVLRVGATPVFVDTDANGLIDLEGAEGAMRASQRIRCLIPVHLYGIPVDLERLDDLRRSFGVHVLEDCAQAIGASWNGRPVGTAGALSAVSFYPTKNLGCMGDGGAVLTLSPPLAEKARMIRDYGQSAKYLHEEVGLNSRLDELHAAILHRVFLPELDHWTARRREIAQAYLSGIVNPRVTLPDIPQAAVPSWHLFPLIVRENRDALARHLADLGIATGIHYPEIIPNQNVFNKPNAPPHRISGTLDRSRNISRHELSLPIHPYLSDEDVKDIVDGINIWS